MINSFGIFLIYLYYFIKIYSLKIIKNLININILFYILKIFYYNFFENKYNKNYKYLLYKNVKIETSFYRNEYIFVGYEYEKIFGIKINLFILLKQNHLILKKNIEHIEKIILKEKYYYNTLLHLLYKYSKYFNKVDKYLLNNIKEYLYK
jgi:hypothetical protein